MTTDLRKNIVWAVTIIGVALAATLARQAGLIEQETVTRIVLTLTGLMIVWYGNRLPKAFVPSANARRVSRVSGWSMALSGLVYAGMFAFAPLDLAMLIGCGAVALGLLVTVGYCLSLRSGAKPSRV